MPIQTRRQFLGAANCAGISSIPILNTLLNLRMSGSLAAATTPGTGEYRALVCLFQSGGNDSFNMLAPYSGPSSTAANSYAEYAVSRADLALTQPPTGGPVGANQLIEIHPTNTPGRTFGVHSGMPHLAALFEQGDAAFVANVGTLIEPVLNRAALTSKRLPLGLYSHSDQIEQWQTSVPHSRSGVGWAGKMLDLIKDLNSNQTVSMNISADGSNVWQTGLTGAEYAISPGFEGYPDSGGAVGLAGYTNGYVDPNVVGTAGITNPNSSAVDGQLAVTYANLLQQTWQNKRREALAAYELFHAATSGAMPGNITFPDTQLGRQLKQVARAIHGRVALGACRQTFFVNRGGWDHHSDTLNLQGGMLPEVDNALWAFWQQLVAMGAQNNVLLFSASDFGRTLTSNGQGSDHAWGSNQFLVGGAVDGQKIFGQYPSLGVNPEVGAEINPLDAGRGRLIPTTSCDQFFAEMALWLGVPKTSLPLILPNIAEFYSTSSTAPPIGFLT